MKMEKRRRRKEVERRGGERMELGEVEEWILGMRENKCSEVIKLIRGA